MVDTNPLVACLGETLEPFFRLISGPDFGDELVGLVASHWPDVHRMLVSSQDPSTEARALGEIRTAAKRQWVVADALRGAQRLEYSHDQALDLIATSLHTMLRVTNFALALPGAIQILGGPDQKARRLKALSGLFSATGDMFGAAQGGIKADELYGLSKAAIAFAKQVHELRD